MLLEARDVTKAFGSFKAVDAASVTLEQGDILGLIGPNGAGKSTFFNCLTGDLASTSGKVMFEGQDITRLAPEVRAQLGLARTFQVPQTFEGMSVLENVMIGAFMRTAHRAEAESRVKAALLVQAIASAEDIVATPADVTAELEALARRYGQPAARIRKALGSNLLSLMDGVVRNKTLDLLVDNAVVTIDQETSGAAS